MGKGLKSFQKRMKAIPVAVVGAVGPAVISGANLVAQTIRALAPDDPTTQAPDLRTSIAVTGPGQSTPPYSQPGGAAVVPVTGAAVTAGNGAVRYPHLLEYGTSKMAARPFFWPGFRLSKKKAAAKIKRGISKAVRAAK